MRRRIREKRSALSPIPLDDAAISRLVIEAKLYREDVISIRFGWSLEFLRKVAQHRFIALMSIDAYYAEHPAIAMREAAASAELEKQRRGEREQRREPGGLPSVPPDPPPPTERRSFYVPFHVKPVAGATLTAEARRRGLPRAALVATIIETLVERNAWDSVLP